MVIVLPVWNRHETGVSFMQTQPAVGARTHVHITYLSVNHHTGSHFLGMALKFPWSGLWEVLSMCGYLAALGPEWGIGDLSRKGLEMET